jgi:DNA repair ATPase RecN
MGLHEILQAAERVGNHDGERREVFQQEFAAYEAGETTTFDETRSALVEEREALDSLETELQDEASNIEAIVDNTEFLTVEQAVRHREATIEKLREHNDHLRAFHDAMTTALDIVEANLDALEKAGPEAVDADPEPQFKRAHEALNAHNDAVEGLSTNMTILNAYLV